MENRANLENDILFAQKMIAACDITIGKTQERKDRWTQHLDELMAQRPEKYTDDFHQWVSEERQQLMYPLMFGEGVKRKRHKLRSALNLLCNLYGSQAVVCYFTGFEKSYLSRLMNGDKFNPSEDKLTALGLERSPSDPGRFMFIRGTHGSPK